ncbi:MAG: bacillithiol biosynthesis deacetylase BshB1 [Clostridia bacterium]
MRQLDILAIGAHPDDVEIGAAGSLLKAAAQGKQTAILDLTYAELSSNGSVERRQEEAGNASTMLNLATRYNFGLPDRGLESVREMAIKKVVDLIRMTRPQVVLAPYWQDRHPDHESASRIVKEAVFSAGIHRFKGFEEELPGYRPPKLYYYFINSTAAPQFVVDVSDVYEQKLDVLRCYRSQFEKEEHSVPTPLNNGYIELVEYRERLFGQQAGTTYGEGFISGGPVVLSELL